MKKIQISLNEMEAKVYELCKSATKGSDNGAMFCFDEVAVPAKKELGLSVEEVKGYLGSLKKKDAIRKLHESYYDFFVPEKCEDDYDWPYLDELYTVEIIVEGAEKPAPSAKKHIKVYQLPVEHKAKFMDLEFVNEHNIMPKLEEYKIVWEGEMVLDDEKSINAQLDTIYCRFNLAHPEDFKGHSLSTSDIVEVDGKFFYCDTYSWEDVTLQNAEPKKSYIVKAYSSSSYIAKYNTREEALAKANELNDEYYQHKIWNVEEVVDEEEMIKPADFHKVTLAEPHILFTKDGNILYGTTKIGTYEKDDLWKKQGGTRDKSGNLTVPYLYYVTIDAMPSDRGKRIFYSREEIKQWLSGKQITIDFNEA